MSFLLIRLAVLWTAPSSCLVRRSCRWRHVALPSSPLSTSPLPSFVVFGLMAGGCLRCFCGTRHFDGEYNDDGGGGFSREWRPYKLVDERSG